MTGVVAAVEQDAADAGAEILRLGGNAVDAAVATALAQGVVDPYRCGIGGGGVCLVYDARHDATFLLNFYGHAPAAAHETMFTPVDAGEDPHAVEGAANLLGHAASVVPGMVRGLAELHRRHGSGRVTWSALFGPAVRLARDGFAAYPFLVRAFDPSSAEAALLNTPATCTSTPEARAVFAPDGTFPRLGRRFRQPDYAASLELIARQGPDEFYEGEPARRIAEHFARHGGSLTADDLRTFRPVEATPIEGGYRGLRLVTESAPSVGPTFLQLMRLLEGWDLAALGYNTPAYVDRVLRALTLVFRERLEHVADPDRTDVPLRWLLSPEHARQGREAIDAALRAGAARPPGHIGTVPRRGPVLRHGPGETTHCSVIDGEGNAASITHSIGSGSGVVVPGTGFMMNNHMAEFDPRPGGVNSVAAGKRPMIGGAPVLVFEGRDLRSAMGSPAGNRKASAMAQMLIGTVDFGLDAQAAVDGDRFHADDVPMIAYVDPQFDPRCAVALATRGYDVRFSPYSARIAAVQRQADGTLVGIGDPRGDRGVATVR